MRSARLVLPLAAVAVTMAAASAAQAQAGVDLTCIVNGNATVEAGLSTHWGDGHGVQNVSDDITDFPAGLDVERGGYNFTATEMNEFACSGTLQGTVFAGITGTLHSEGYWDMLTCGTGYAHDLDGSNTSMTFLNGLVTLGTGGNGVIGYEITFNAGTGHLRVGPDGAPSQAGMFEALPADSDPTYPGGVHGKHDADGDAVRGSSLGWSAMHDDMDSTFTGTGSINITPTAPDNCATAQSEGTTNYNDTDAFDVAGSFTISG
jgi:hypothetical protein